MQMIADWKLQVMCKFLLQEIWVNRKEAILQVEEFLKSCYQTKTVNKTESTILIRRIEKTKQKLSNLIDMRTEGDISIEEYRKRKKKLEEELTEYEQQLKNQSAAPVQEKNNELNWKAIREAVDELIDFSKPKIDNNIVDKFIARIIPQGNNRFTWFVNVSGRSTEEVDMIIEGRKNHATVHIDEQKDVENDEDDESSVHNGEKYSVKCGTAVKKYSLVWLPHRLLSMQNRRTFFR